MGWVDPLFDDSYTPRMSLAERRVEAEEGPSEDHFVHLHGVSWSDYERVMKLRGEGSVPRLAYQEGVLELMSPSHDHESITSMLGRLVDVWCEEHGIEFTSLLSWTLKSKKRRGGVEPDECFIFGEDSKKKRPDLAIEVIRTSGGIDKRNLYHRFGVPELWFWKRGRISIHSWRPRAYQAISRSAVLPGIDLAELVSFVDVTPMSKAMREYRAALRRTRR
jgi:Uma2 family endonuclease